MHLDALLEAAASGSDNGDGDDDDDDDGTDHLLVVAGECNLTGDRPPIAAIANAFSRKALSSTPDLPRHGRYWLLLDAAKLGATYPLDLSTTGAAMACISLYKIFGEPTGLGALLVRSDLARKLKRPSADNNLYYGGGSVNAVLASDAEYLVPKQTIASALTPGTPHYRGAMSVPAGFDELKRLGGMDAIHLHTMALAHQLASRLRGLVHDNGVAAITMYGAWATDTKKDEPLAVAPGPTIAFNVRRRSGEWVGYSEVIKLASLHDPPIQLRGGCCCNPGGCQLVLGLSDDDVRAAAAAGKECGDGMDSFDGHLTGIVRASLGKDSVLEDIDVLIRFLEGTFVACANDSSTGAAADMMATQQQTHHHEPALLKEIYVYPIKSCAGMRCASWWAHPKTGRLLYDREWALVDSCGNVMRLSMHPNLAMIRPTIDVERSTMTLEASGGSQPPLILPLVAPAEEAYPVGAMEEEEDADAPQRRRVDVCGKECQAREFGGAAAASWLSAALGVQCRLVRYHGGGCDEQQDVAAATASDKDAGGGVAFANEAPLLLVQQSAVGALNHSLRAGEPA